MTYSDLHSDSYAQFDGAVCSPSSDGAVIYSPLSGTYYAVNEVAASIWEYIAHGATAAQVAAALAEKYDAPRAILEEDVRTTLRHLESLKLVERVPGEEHNAAS